MPELPEVETAKNGITAALRDKIIVSTQINRPNLRTPFPKQMKERLEGKRCINLRRRGKYIWVDLDSKETLVIHLGMSGSLTINKKETSKHDHVVFVTNDSISITYHDPRRFGMMFFIETGRERQHKAFTNMGPEPLGNEFNADILFAKLQSKKNSIKTALLDQNVVAGVGNIYACEALYQSGISPLRLAHDIKHSEIEDLVQAVRNVLSAAIQSGGSSLRDHRQADGTLGYFQHHFHVYDREGETCKITGGQIVRIQQSGRSTFYCPAKQR